MPQRDTCHFKFYSVSLFIIQFFLIFFTVIMPQASGRIIHGNLRPKDNDEGINKDLIYATYNEQLGLDSGLRISHSKFETCHAHPIYIQTN